MNYLWIQNSRMSHKFAGFMVHTMPHYFAEVIAGREEIPAKKLRFQRKTRPHPSIHISGSHDVKKLSTCSTVLRTQITVTLRTYTTRSLASQPKKFSNWEEQNKIQPLFALCSEKQKMKTICSTIFPGSPIWQTRCPNCKLDDQHVSQVAGLGLYPHHWTKPLEHILG